MRETRTHGSEGRESETNQTSLPLSDATSVLERKLIRLPCGDPFFEVAAADGLVRLVAADLDLRSVSDRFAVLAES